MIEFACKTIIVKKTTLAITRQNNVNAKLSTKEVKHFCTLSEKSHQFLAQAMNQFDLSRHAYHCILKLARTIASLANSEQINIVHLSEAMAYRKLDRAI